MWSFSQSTGTFSKDGVVVAHGYSGLGNGLNNPNLQDVPNIGPIPRGQYKIGSAHNTDTHGPVVMALTPFLETEVFGRSGFLIHGASAAHPLASSHGCIILIRPVREQVAASPDRELAVVV